MLIGKEWLPVVGVIVRNLCPDLPFKFLRSSAKDKPKREWYDALLILLMSSQVDGHIQLPSSYNFNKDSVVQYRRNTISPKEFSLWVSKDMYASTYAKYHSPVLPLSSRTLCSLETLIFADILALFQESRWKFARQHIHIHEEIRPLRSKFKRKQEWSGDYWFEYNYIQNLMSFW